MTLSSPTVVGFSVVAGMPSDVRQWVTVDLAGYPGAGRRGYIVATEPLGPAWNALGIAARVREIIITELRRRQHMPADEALGRALAVANGVVTGQGRDQALNGPERAPLIGVTAIIFDDHDATIGRLPPGQYILIQDGLTYAVPEFDSWFPSYQPEELPGEQAEPLGYARWAAPLIAQTSMRTGDTIILANQELGRALAEELTGSGLAIDDLQRWHRQDPDGILGIVRDIVIDRDMSSAAVAVIAFPPLPASLEIQTLADVKRRSLDAYQHIRAILRPSARAQADQIQELVEAPVEQPYEVMPHPASNTRNLIVDRVNKVFEPRMSRQELWRRLPDHTQFGVPAKHGVDVFRGQPRSLGESGWQHHLPRLPIIGTAWIWFLAAVLLVGAMYGVLEFRNSPPPATADVAPLLAQIDRALVAARDERDQKEAAREIQAVLQQIAEARLRDVPSDLLDPRELVATELLDGATNVVRTSDVQRIGSLPEEFRDSRVQGISTPSGVFFVAGSLYQYRPNMTNSTPDLVMILEEGSQIGTTTVGRLWGVAFDIHGLYVTDGSAVFVLPVESQQWQAVELGKINNQLWSPGPVAAFDGALYLLQAEYRQIYRFPIVGTRGIAEPRDWLQTGARDRIDDAVDITIDGNIYVLLSDGAVLVMLRGALQEDIEPTYIEPDITVALSGPGASGYLYAVVSDQPENSGRIVAFDRTGQHAVQLRLPIGFTTGDVDVRLPFDGVQDMIVDESTGTIYIINADAVWTTRYSLPSLPALDTIAPDDGIAVATPAA